MVDLNQVEVATFTRAEAIVTVQLDLSQLSWVSRGLTEVEFLKSINFTRVELVVAPLVSNETEINVRALYIGVLLDNPDKLLDGVVEVETDLSMVVADGFATSELELLNKVLVGDLSKTATLVSVKVDVVNEEASGSKMGLVLTEANVIWVSSVDENFIKFTELNVNTDLVILKSNQW